MPDFKFQRDTNRFFSLGMDLNRPGDQLKELKYKLLKNVRSYQTGRMEPRQGLTLIGSVAGLVHSIRRLNAPRTGLWTRIIGNGTFIHAGTTSFTQIDTGYSGDPLALVPYRPSQSSDPWMYCMDRLRQRKMDVTGTLHQVGMPPPTLPPVVTLGAQHFKEIFDADMTLAGWNNGPAFVATFPQQENRVSTTISSILYDSGNTGWCLVEPGTTAGINDGTLLNLNSSETVVAKNVNTGSTTPTAIGSIAALSDGVNYSVVFTTLTSDLMANTLLYNDTRLNYARIKSVITGPNGIQTVICSPTNWAVGDAVYLKSSFRCYTTATHAIGETVTNSGLSVDITNTNDPALPLTGWIWSPKFVPALDLSHITTTIGSTKDSYISMGVSFEKPANATFARVMFGCTDTADHEKAFLNDYFYKEFTPADLVTPSGISSSTTKNSSRLTFKLADLIAVGNPSLKNILSIQIEMSIRPINFDGEFVDCRIFFDSLYLSGEPGPDVGSVGSPYIYRYRARTSSTGVVSNWSPATREGFQPQGEWLTLVAPSQYTLATEADIIDFQRRGGSIPDNWYYVGSVDNTTPPTSFTDKYADDVIVANPSSDQENYQLWPLIGAATSGTVTSIDGVLVTGTGFSTSWAPQTPILIAGTWYTIYQVYSPTQLEIFESGGTQTNITWEIPEPILQGQPLPCFWGPLNDTFFGCGDLYNPQRLYWTNVGDPDSTTTTKWRDITTPSEPLMNGVVYNGRAYVWSTERFFQIVPTQQEELSGAVSNWDYVEIPNGKGLWARWAFTSPQSVPGEVLFFLGKDGIYGTDGGSPSDVTAEDLRPLFPNEGNLGSNINTVSAPWMVPDFHAQFRLAYYDDYLYFEYPDSGSYALKSFSFTDDMNNWGDSLASRFFNIAFSDSLNGWLDTLRTSGAVTPPAMSDSMQSWGDSITIVRVLIPPLWAIYTDDLNTWADTLGVTLT